MPKMLYGTAWKKERTSDLVVEAVRAGFKGIDTACQPKHYNEAGVGEALKILSHEGITRQNLFIQTKFTSLDGQDPNNIPYDKTAPLTTQVQQSLNASLRNLGTAYIDSLVLHSPMKTHEQTLQVWRVFEDYVDAGQVRQLGLSNCYSLKTLQQLFDEVRIKPSVLQNRLYPDTDYDTSIRDFCKKEGVFYQSFWTLTANPTILRNKNVEAIASSKGKTTEQIFFAYLIQTGVITPLTGTTSKKHMLEDLEAMDIKLSRAEANVFDELMM